MYNLKENIKWTFSVIYQIYDQEDRIYFEYLKEDIELTYQTLTQRIDFFILVQDEIKQEVSTLVLSEFGKLDFIIKQEPMGDFYSNTNTVENIWTSFFKLPASYQKSNHFVMTHGHAAGLGFFSKPISKESRKIARNQPFQALTVLLSHSIVEDASNPINKNRLHEFFSQPGNLSSKEILRHYQDEGSGIIPLVCLKRAIANSFTKKVDFVFLGNCFMQTLENGYLLKDNVNYLAATEGFFFVNGSDYRRIFQTLSQSDINDFKSISYSIVDGINSKLSDSRILRKYQDNMFELEKIDKCFSFSVNSLAKYEEIKQALNRLAVRLLADFEKLLPTISNTREDIRITRDVYHRQQLGITDLSRFFKNLALAKGIITNFQEVYRLVQILDNTINNRNNPLTINYRFPYGSFEPYPEKFGIFPHGVSIFFPRKKPVHQELDAHITYFIENYYSEDELLGPFLAGNEWKNFLTKYYYSDVENG